MEIVNNYEVVIANFLCSLETQTTQTEDREALKAAVGDDLDLLIDALNALIVFYNRQVYSGAMTASKAAKTVKSEYRAIGFTDVLEWEAIAEPYSIYYERMSIRERTPSEQLARLRQMYTKNETCANERIKTAVLIYTLRLMTHFGLVIADMEFTQELMIKINAITEEQKAAAILPPAMIMEL